MVDRSDKSSIRLWAAVKATKVLGDLASAVQGTRSSQMGRALQWGQILRGLKLVATVRKYLLHPSKKVAGLASGILGRFSELLLSEASRQRGEVEWQPGSGRTLAQAEYRQVVLPRGAVESLQQEVGRASAPIAALLTGRMAKDGYIVTSLCKISVEQLEHGGVELIFDGLNDFLQRRDLTPIGFAIGRSVLPELLLSDCAQLARFKRAFPSRDKGPRASRERYHLQVLRVALGLCHEVALWSSYA